MALKVKISKEVYEKLSADLKAEYVEKDGDFVLDLDGAEDTSALKRAKDRESQLRRDAEKKLKEIESELEKLSGDDARKRGDIETLEKAWQKKQEEIENGYKSKLSAKDAFLKNSLVDNVAKEISFEISKNPSLILPHIKSRLQADLESETPSTKVLDSEGNISTMTIKELKEEFRANKDFASIIIGSKASGSGAPTGEHQKTRVSAMGDDGKTVQLANLQPKALAERIALSKEQRQE